MTLHFSFLQMRKGLIDSSLIFIFIMTNTDNSCLLSKCQKNGHYNKTKQSDRHHIFFTCCEDLRKHEIIIVMLFLVLIYTCDKWVLTW